MNASDDLGSTRRERFEAALADLRRTDGATGRERWWSRIGVVMMAIGGVTAAVAFAVSLRLADTRDVGSMIVLAGLCGCLTVAGATLFLAHALSRALRLLLLRVLYESERRERRGPRTLADPVVDDESCE